ncbi:GntR family transcriptional regulator [Herbidospora sp. NEAU-GS84]|uniref:GntR family transcriptional regulator n=1 Tax=Herbidospora solisilvae TaxID=2696284 RepID=A0A7C9JUZ1_9ACTN|nr:MULTISPECIES: GntR family transcriptional regulator [Herbidospora]NAS23239.1 GntR family transcriptional regulator [Herbidospora solisilvae]GLX92171.1 hypothetical protein Hesp01_01210 [Herbidospora sp. NBRC 101105]
MLDREGPVPVYKQIAEELRQKIADGELSPGDAIPSEAELEAEYNVARMTARRVARELRDQGLAYTIQGEGTFVGTPDTPRSELPVYQQIAKLLAEKIRSGEFPANRALPSEKVLMAEHGVAKATVRQAIATLRKQGYVFTVPYRGTYATAREKWPKSKRSTPASRQNGL